MRYWRKPQHTETVAPRRIFLQRRTVPQSPPLFDLVDPRAALALAFVPETVFPLRQECHPDAYLGHNRLNLRAIYPARQGDTVSPLSPRCHPPGKRVRRIAPPGAATVLVGRRCDLCPPRPRPPRRVRAWRSVTGNGAQKRTRTSTPLRAPAPEAGASTNSAIWARVTCRETASCRVGARH